MTLRVISASEISQHATPNDCWVIIHNKVYDLTKFLDEHPGGKKVISNWAGKDGTAAFADIHPSDMIERLGREDLCVGIIEESARQTPIKLVDPSEELRAHAPPIHSIINLDDMRKEAEKIMTKEGWDYYSSGAGDELTLAENQLAFRRIRFRPRVLVDVSKIDTTHNLLGFKSALPIYVTATALGRLAHPDAEAAIVRGAHASGVPYMLPTLSSCSLDEMLAAKVQPNQCIWFQLYVNSNKEICEKLIKKAFDGGCSTLFITVDAPQLGRREKDLRNKPAAISDVQQNKKEDLKEESGVSNALSHFIDPSLDWERIHWIRSIMPSAMKLFLKGVQISEDALLAFDSNIIDGIVVSNHGGRQLDTARSGVEALVEIVECLQMKRGFFPSLQLKNNNNAVNKKRFDIFVDGGITRATDALKCIALGATGVGVGRAALHGLAVYGQQGVSKVLSLLKIEMEVAMSMLGVQKIEDVCRSCVQLPFEAKL